MCTRGARGGLKLNRTLRESPRHRLADSAATPKEKHPFLFQKKISPPPNQKCKECFFFRGSALDYSGSRRSEMRCSDGRGRKGLGGGIPRRPRSGFF